MFVLSLAGTYHFLIISYVCFARWELLSKEGQPQTGEEPWPTPWSSHTCTEVKSPEAQAPRTAAPTRTDSASCDRTTGMPAQDKATPWLGSQQAAPATETPDMMWREGSSGHPLPVPHSARVLGMTWFWRISQPVPAGKAGRSPEGPTTTYINSEDLFAQISQALASCYLPLGSSSLQQTLLECFVGSREYRDGSDCPAIGVSKGRWMRKR